MTLKGSPLVPRSYNFWNCVMVAGKCNVVFWRAGCVTVPHYLSVKNWYLQHWRDSPVNGNFVPLVWHVYEYWRKTRFSRGIYFFYKFRDLPIHLYQCTIHLYRSYYNLYPSHVLFFKPPPPLAFLRKKIFVQFYLFANLVI